MQTFLPYPSFRESAMCLDYRRLGKQRVEAWQIYQTLTGQSMGWINHPATRMWRDYENSLLAYGHTMCEEWIRRNYQDNMLMKFRDIWDTENTIKPSWIGDLNFHLSHQSNLLRKDPIHYSQFGWQVGNDLPYVWPV